MKTPSYPVEVTLQVACNDEATPLLPAATEFAHWVNTAVLTCATSVPSQACVTVRLVDEAEIQALNARFRGRSEPTNVLAFPGMLPGTVSPAGAAETELGDIVLCAGLAVREAREQGKPFVAHAAHLVVHGSLHLLGHDHMETAEAEAMEAIESRIMQELGFPNPWSDGYL